MPIRGKKQRFTDNNISNAPTDNGVYVLSRYRRITYIGKGEGEGGIRSRLQAAKQDTRGRGKATSFQSERSKNASKREKQLLEQYKKKHRKLPPYNERLG